MNESHTPQYNNAPPVEELRLKDKNTEELYAALCTYNWSPAERQQIDIAYALVAEAHKDDRHKDRPYTEHLLRVANRLVHYMNITDSDVILAGILHDVAEDHALEIINGQALPDEYKPNFDIEEVSAFTPVQQQSLALYHLGVVFSPNVSTVVAGVTNAPKSEHALAYEEKLQAYADKIADAIESPEVWLVKFADWCDNGLGINYDMQGQGNKREHFIRKYGLVLPILKARYEREDMQALLTDKAKRYIDQQLQLGEVRLGGS